MAAPGANASGCSPGRRPHHRPGPPGRLEAIAEAAIAAGHTTPAEVDHLLAALHRIAADDHTVGSLPRIVQAWGRRRRA